MISSIYRIFCVGLLLFLVPGIAAGQGQSPQAQRIAQLQMLIGNLEQARAFTQDTLNKVASGRYLIVSIPAGEDDERNYVPVSRDEVQQMLAAQILTGERSSDEAAEAARQAVRLTRAFAAVARSRLSKLDFLIARAHGELATLLRHQPPPSPHPTPRPFSDTP